MDNIGKIAVIFSVLGIFALYALSTFSTPPLVPLDEIPNHRENFVRVRGILTEIHFTKQGNAILRVENLSQSVQVFVPRGGVSGVGGADVGSAKLNFSLGDEVEVEGIVKIFDGIYEIVAKDIRKLRSSEFPAFSVSQVSSQPQDFVGRKIRVAGCVKRTYKRVFHLCDCNGSFGEIRVLLNFERGTKIERGAKVAVDGYLRYNPEGMRYELISTAVYERSPKGMNK